MMLLKNIYIFFYGARSAVGSKSDFKVCMHVLIYDVT